MLEVFLEICRVDQFALSSQETEKNKIKNNLAKGLMVAPRDDQFLFGELKLSWTMSGGRLVVYIKFRLHWYFKISAPPKKK